MRNELIVDILIKEVIDKIELGIACTFHHPEIVNEYSISGKTYNGILFRRYCYGIGQAEDSVTLMTKNQLVECLKDEGFYYLNHALFESRGKYQGIGKVERNKNVLPEPPKQVFYFMHLIKDIGDQKLEKGSKETGDEKIDMVYNEVLKLIGQWQQQGISDKEIYTYLRCFIEELPADLKEVTG